MLDRVDIEGFLEVKVPLNTLFATILYINDVLDEIRKEPKRRIVHFGPSKVEEREPHR